MNQGASGGTRGGLEEYAAGGDERAPAGQNAPQVGLRQDGLPVPERSATMPTELGHEPDGRPAAGVAGDAAGGAGSGSGRAAGAQRHAEATPPSDRKPGRAGRNLPAAVAVGLGLGGLVVLTLFTVKATFLLYLGIMCVAALWELRDALGSRDIRLPLLPVVLGGTAMVTLAYWTGPKQAIAAVAVTAIGVLAWRLPGGAAGFVRDITAGIFAMMYVPLMALFVALMLVEPDGSRRAFIFIVLAVCSDTFGYLAGILIGKHPMAPRISPNKTWEGLGGSVIACLTAGAIMVPGLLGGQVWQGLLLGAAAVAAATLGDLAESMMKRDLAIKDMGHLLPGHGGILDRIDSLLVMAPLVWLLLDVFVRNGHAA